MEEVMIQAAHVSMRFYRELNEANSVKERLVRMWKGERQVVEVKALNDVSYTIGKGEIVGIRDRNCIYFVTDQKSSIFYPSFLFHAHALESGNTFSASCCWISSSWQFSAVTRSVGTSISSSTVSPLKICCAHWTAYFPKAPAAESLPPAWYRLQYPPRFPASRQNRRR